jgi:hypothetical protein
MRWTVVWTDEALDQLADLWTSGDDRADVTDASQEADRLLRDRPLEVGEERVPPERLLLVSPLSLLYQVSPDDMLVTVIAVWQWKQR